MLGNLVDNALDAAAGGWFVAVAIGGLVAWGCFLALGAYLGLDPQTPDHDWRRVLVVAATTGGFLLFWLAALALISRWLWGRVQARIVSQGG